jgi:hypothetical protein
MAFADYLTLTSMIGVAAAEAMKGDTARVADLSAAAEALGLNSETLAQRSHRSLDADGANAVRGP